MTRKHQFLTVLLLSAAPAAASPAHTPPADADVSKTMLDLRGELLNAGRDKAQANVSKFRPLCDKDGYPLVGNLANKPNMYQPSEFCSDIRKAEKRS